MTKKAGLLPPPPASTGGRRTPPLNDMVPADADLTPAAAEAVEECNLDAGITGMAGDGANSDMCGSPAASMLAILRKWTTLRRTTVEITTTP